jgi:hypothetical protein
MKDLIKLLEAMSAFIAVTILFMIVTGAFFR